MSRQHPVAGDGLRGHRKLPQGPPGADPGLSPWRTVCAVCERPIGAARQCPYCDEPALPTEAGRRLQAVALALGLLGALVILASPAGLSASALPPLTADSFGWWLPAALLGALAGLVAGVPWPWLVLALGAPPLLRAAALGGFAASALAGCQVADEDDPNVLVTGRSPPLAAWATTRVLLLVAWGLAAVAWAAPAFCLTVMLVLRAHGRWLAAAALLTVALCAKPDLAVPPSRRLAALRSALAGPAAGLALWALGLWLGARFLVLPSAAPFAAVGVFALSPALWSLVGTNAAPLRRRASRPVGPPGANWPEKAALRMLVLALLALGPLQAGEDPLGRAISFAAAATLAGAVLALLPALRRMRPAAAPGVAFLVCLPLLLAMLPWSGVPGVGALLLATAYSLWLRWARLPVLLHLAIWVPLLR